MPPDFSRNVHCLFGLPIDAVDMAGAERLIRSAAERRAPCFLSTPNLNFLIACQSDSAFRDSVINSDLSIADGIPIVWLSRLLGIPIRERVAGSTLFDRLRHGAGRKIAVYFFGGADGAAEAACRQIAIEGQGMTCAGHESPGFGSIEDMSTEALIQRINASNADFLVIALGARKGQSWIVHNRHRLNTPVISHLGAVVNFVAGTVNRAPAWLQYIGLEWLWRIKEEPALAYRYLSDGWMFLRLLAGRALPWAWLMVRRRPGAAELGLTAIELHHGNSEILVRLHGPWVQGNLAPLRAAFTEVARAGKAARIDLTHVTYVDPALLGLLLLLYGAQTGRDHRLCCVSPTATVRRIFTYGDCGFLLDNET